MHVIVHYSEIGTKGKNRIFFEKKLMENIKKSLGKNVEIYRRYGRIVLETEDNDLVKKRLEMLPGISNFIFSLKTSLDVDEMKRSCIKALKEKKFKTFRVSSSRSNKKFEKTSQELNEIIGEEIVKKLKKKVDLKKPDITIYIEVCEKEAFIGFEKSKGIGGLPVSSSGRVISSLSGGIDSPVASFLMMKRGCEVVFVHIFNSTQTSSGMLTKIQNIVKKLTKVQLNSKLYMVPFEELQRKIIAIVPSKYRMVIYRRFMMRILNKLAKKEGAKCIITGDSIGQVASQTIENLNCIYDASDLPVLSPLIGMNKEEIIELAKKIGTYEFSIEHYPDCCSFMISKHPVTKGDLEKVEEIENFLKNQKKLIEKCIKRAKVKSFALK